jgi:predicted ATPase
VPNDENPVHRKVGLGGIQIEVDEMSNKRKSGKHAASGISHISVSKLFSRYDYDLDLDDDLRQKLAILYGDNGSGKTTLLKLAFNLLAHQPLRGHKTAISQIPFSDFTVTFKNGTVVSAHRASGEFTGSFRQQVRQGQEILAEAQFTAKENVIPKDYPSKEAARRARELGRTLQGMNLGLFYLSDDRELISNVFEEPEQLASDLYAAVLEQAHIGQQERLVQRKLSVRKPIDAALEAAIEKAETWVRQQVLSGAQKGEADTNEIYTSIIEKLASEQGTTKSSELRPLPDLVVEIKSQAARTLEYSRFGITPAADITRLVEALSRVRRNQATISKIAESYVNGLRARLDALQDIQSAVERLVDIVNSFYTDKSLQFDLKKGIRVISSGDSLLPPRALSSGEKQLLLLFCNTLVAKEEASIFFIDEPELSLNIKWQRALIGALLSATSGSTVQFLLATHSFELLAPYDSHVVELNRSRA